MKLLTFISYFLFMFQQLHSQEFNLRNEHGQKTGEWVEYFENGRIKELKHYTPIPFNSADVIDTILLPDIKDTIFNVDLEKAKLKLAYQYGLVDGNGKIIGLPSKLDWTEKYEYNEEGAFKRTLKTDSEFNSIYLYGSEKEIAIDHFDFSVDTLVGKYQTVRIPLENHSPKDIRLAFAKLPGNFNSHNSYLIPANSEYRVELQVSPEPGRNTHSLRLKGPNFTIPLTIQSTGYHIESSVLETDKPFVLTAKKFFYKRSYSEALLTITKQGEELKHIPLTYERTEIDLSELESGNYIFEITRFSPKGKISKMVEIK